MQFWLKYKVCKQIVEYLYMYYDHFLKKKNQHEKHFS